MKHVNGDLDDLFRRASDRYPLRADGANWDRLANALDKDPEPPSENVEDKRRRRGIFWWFLLVPLAGLGYLTWQVRAHHSSGKGIVAESVGNGAAAVRSGKAPAPVTGVGQAGSSAGGGNAVVGGSAGQAGSAVGGGGAGQAGSAVGGEDVSKVRTRGVEGANAGGDQGSRGGNQSILGGGKVRKMRTGNTGGRDAAGMNGTGSARLEGTESARLNGTGSASLGGIGAAGGSTGASMAAGGAMGTGTIGYVGDGEHDPALALLDLRRAAIGGGYKVVVDVVAPKAAADGTVPAAKKQSGKVSHGYIGIVGAPDFSMVKFQSMKGVGTTFGLLLGYSFNDRWAVESGVYLDRKRYYTEGEYFNTKGVQLPSNYYNLLNVDGTCFMWEIPLNIRYNFNKSEKMKWFATAGLSTYLMTKENYTYQYNYWSGGPTKDSAWKIDKPSQYWFSVVNLSVGYEQRLGKIGNLRLEPYVRLPLSGIGTGRLPIMSAGLNIGFTRRLW